MKTTSEVAALLGVNPKTLLRTVERHDKLKPAKKIGTSFVWTNEEIEAVRQHISSVKMGRPKKGVGNADNSTPR